MPLTMYDAPSRSARVRIEARSEPALGSENPWHHTTDPPPSEGGKLLPLFLAVPNPMRAGPIQFTFMYCGPARLTVGPHHLGHNCCCHDEAALPPNSFGQLGTSNPCWASASANAPVAGVQTELPRSPADGPNPRGRCSTTKPSSLPPGIAPLPLTKQSPWRRTHPSLACLRHGGSASVFAIPISNLNDCTKHCHDVPGLGMRNRLSLDTGVTDAVSDDSSVTATTSRGAAGLFFCEAQQASAAPARR